MSLEGLDVTHLNHIKGIQRKTNYFHKKKKGKPTIYLILTFFH